MTPRVHRFLSLGAGIQSSTLYLMAVRRELERPDAAIFADTQWEPAAVYAWLDVLERIGGHLIPIRRVSAGNIREAALTRVEPKGGKPYRRVSLPVFVENAPRPYISERGRLKRQCTRQFKIRPIQAEVRRLLSVARGGRVPRAMLAEQWIGISVDEASRMKDSGLPWLRNRWPLIERRMTRQDCVQWLERNGFSVPPKSACIGCPYTDRDRWRDRRARQPTEWADAVAFDEAIRHGLVGVTHEAYLHPSLRPLRELDFSTLEEHGQVNLFENECEGMCGV
jgi:hypothetical protein